MQLPVMHVFKKRDGRIFHFWSTETMSNHVDTVWPYWNLMDFTPEGRPDRQTPPQKIQVRVFGEELSEQGVAGRLPRASRRGRILSRHGQAMSVGERTSAGRSEDTTAGRSGSKEQVHAANSGFPNASA